MTDPILILGSGAMACLFAARLAASGRAVRMLAAWPEGLKALQESGVTLIDAGGNRCSFPVLATHNAADCQGARLALVLVKSWQTERAARQLKECLSPDGLALTLQNGLGNFESLANALGEERTAAGAATLGATLAAPGQVQAGGEGEIILAKHPRLALMRRCLQDAGFRVRVVANRQSLLWGKLVINAAINPLATLLEVPNGRLLESPSAAGLLRRLVEESCQTAKAAGIRLPYGRPLQQVEEVIRQTAGNTCSMLQDWRRAAPTEIEAISGAVVEHAQELGLAVPLNAAILQILRARLETRTERPGA